MKLNSILAIVLVVMLVADMSDGWLFSRRRRSCTKVNCVKVWGGYQPCTCLGTSYRVEYIQRQALCGGAACSSLQHGYRPCPNSLCVSPHGYCNLSTKKCVCQPGRMGTRCEKACPTGKFGRNCASRCTCSKGSICDPATGYCRCSISWYGNRCEKRYPVNKQRYRYMAIASNTKCFIQERISMKASEAISICPKTHYANRCLCGARTNGFNLFYGTACTCRSRVANNSKFPAIHRNKFVAQSICCPLA